MNPWPGSVVVALIVLVIIIAGTNSDGDAAGEATAPTSSPSPSPSDPGGTPEQEPDMDATNAAGAASTDSPVSRGVALTFDDGPHPEYTPQILDILDEYDVRAVFCVVGAQVERHPELVRRIVDEGHALCNHTYDHDARLKDRSDDEIRKDLTRTERAIKEAAPDAVVSYVRQPMRYVTDNVAAVAETMDYRPLNWSIDTRDWERPGKPAIVSTVEDNLQPGAIILMHDGGGDRQDTVNALPDVIDAIADAGLPTVIPERPFTAELLLSRLRSLW